jgi:hypothetical protein
MTKRTPQWDDWRCYRCARWLPGDEVRHPHVTPAGITVAICDRCHKEQADKK